jgi:hypothetical protein
MAGRAESARNGLLPFQPVLLAPRPRKNERKIGVSEITVNVRIWFNALTAGIARPSGILRNLVAKIELGRVSGRFFPG